MSKLTGGKFINLRKGNVVKEKRKKNKNRVKLKKIKPKGVDNFDRKELKGKNDFQKLSLDSTKLNSKRTSEDFKETFESNELKVENGYKAKDKKKIGNADQVLAKNSYDFNQVKSKKKKRKMEEEQAEVQSKMKKNFVINSPTTEIKDSLEEETVNKNIIETKSNSLDNPNLDSNLEITKENLPDPNEIPECDLMLNIVSLPVIKKPDSNSNSKQKRHNTKDTNIKETITNSKEKEEVQNKLLNNETNLKTVHIEDLMIGEVGSKIEKNIKVPEGVKLKFKGVQFGRVPHYIAKEMGPKKSYKHLIKGDITLMFKNSNLDEIEGYAAGQAENPDSNINPNNIIKNKPKINLKRKRFKEKFSNKFP